MGWRFLNPRDPGDQKIMLKRAKAKDAASKTVGVLLRAFGGREMYWDANYVGNQSEEEFQKIVQADTGDVL